MLTTLRIKNLALVADLTWELQPGYNVITGETGAGKSILIGALNLVLGERADRTLIRSGADACTVEACFDVTRLRTELDSFFTDNGLEPCEDHQLLVKRTFSANGVNRQFINGSPTTLNVLGALGESLVDIHGPHEHQSLFHSSRQLSILDAFANLQDLRSRFAGVLRQIQELESAKVGLIVDETTYAQQMDLLRFQANEIKAAKLKPDEEPELQAEFQRASNAARLLQLSQTCQSILAEDENALLTRAGVLGRTLQELQKIDPSAGSLAALHEQAVSSFQELQRDMAVYADRLEIDPLRYQELEDRLNLIQSLKRKYGSTLTQIIEFGTSAAQKLAGLEQRDAELIRINDGLAKLQTQLLKIGQDLSSQRKKAIPKLGKAVVKQLTDLGFKQSFFDVAIQSGMDKSDPIAAATASGLDSVEFQFAPNPGETARPLRAIASSGELARVMLALKTVLAAEDQIPVLVFDEVDANVGGETARSVGIKMAQIAQQRQVLCITHLAPVAAPADTHFVVAKETQGGRTTSSIRALTERKTRVTELARMLGGQSEGALRHAEELLTK